MILCGPDNPALRSCGAINRWVTRLMDIVLHIGAHRCATTTFQSYLETNAAPLTQARLAIWTPRDTRHGRFDALAAPDIDKARRAAGRISVQRQVHIRAGMRSLLISDENLIGATRANLRAGQLYPDLLARFRRVRAVLGPVRRIGFAIRSYESYWSSALSYAVLRGHRLPARDVLGDLSRQDRRWTDVVRDVAAVFPQSDVLVWRFEDYAATPHQKLRLLCEETPHRQRMLQSAIVPQNPSPSCSALCDALRAQGRTNTMIAPGTGRWVPFTPDQQDRMRDQYLDDLHVLHTCSFARLATPVADVRPQFETELTGAINGASDAARPLTGDAYGTQKRLV